MSLRLAAHAFAWAEVCARRLERNGLASPSEYGRPADIVRAMCGAHAQVFAAAELSVGIRSLGISHAEVRRGLWGERSLVKTYGPRGTVHLLPAEDLPLWTGALGAIPPVAAIRNRFLTPGQTDEVILAIAGSLRTDELTAAELGDAVVPANIRPGFQPAAADKAVSWLVRAYLFSYGPATPAHFAQWLSADRHWATELFESLSGELVPATIDGSPGWIAAGDTKKASRDPSCVRLLPYFDAYIVGCQPRDRLFEGEAADRGLSGGQAGNFPVVLIDGAVGGLWHQRRSGRRVEITAELFRPLTMPQKDELRAQAERIGDFLGAEPSLVIGPIRAGAHA
jgi:hypothetical protein